MDPPGSRNAGQKNSPLAPGLMYVFRHVFAAGLFLALLVLPARLPAQGEGAAADSGRVRTVQIRGRLPEARPAVVLLPAGYGRSARRYPVLYLLHGLWGGHRDWLDRTNLAQYTRDLPAIVVLPDAGDSWYANSPSDTTARFEDYVAQDVPDYVDRHFRTLPFPAARYVAGLSMGGYGAYRLALRQPGKFSLVASFSGAFVTGTDTAYKGMAEAFGPPGSPARAAGDVPRLLEEARLTSPPYFYLDAGTSDPLLRSSREVAAALARRGFAYEYHEVRGAHSWEYWNRRLPVVLEIVRERVRALP